MDQERMDELRPEIGRDERSLIKLAFTGLGGRPKHKTIRREWTSEVNGRTKRFYKIVTGADQYGLPRYPAEEVYVGLLYYSARTEFESNKLEIPARDLLNLMQWGTGGRSYRRLKRSLGELTGVLFETNALWDAKAKSYVEVGFHILDSYRIKRLKEAPLFGEQERTVLEVRWGEELFDYFQRARFKMLNVETYYSLSQPLAKRLYRWLDEALYPHGVTQIDLRHLAHNRLEVSESKKYPSQIMQTLEPAMDELKERGIANWRLEDSQTESGKKLVFTTPRPDRPELKAYGEAEENPGTSGASEPTHDPFDALSEEEYRAVRQVALETLDDDDRKTLEAGEPSPVATARLINAMEDLIEERDLTDLLAAAGS